MTDEEVTDDGIPALCSVCNDARRYYERFLFDRGTSGAHVMWECDRCGDTGTLVVSREFRFATTDPRSFNIS